MMTLDDYQRRAKATAIYPVRSPIERLSYLGLKLNGEVAEQAVAALNLAKLADRAARGALAGSGDDR